MRFLVAGAAFSLLLTASPVTADQRLNQSTTLELSTRTPRIRDANTKAEYPLDAKSTRFVVTRNVSVVLAIADANPLLFEYASATKEEEAASFTAAAAFAQSLSKLLSLFPASLAADAQRSKVDGLAPGDLIDALKDLSTHMDRIPNYLRLSIGTTEDVARLKTIVLSVETRELPDRIDKLYGLVFDLAQKCLQDPSARLTIDGRIAADCSTPLDLALVVDLDNNQQSLGRLLAQRAELQTDLDRQLLRQQAATAELTNAQTTRKKAKTAGERTAGDGLVKEANQRLASATTAVQTTQKRLADLGDALAAEQGVRNAESSLAAAKRSGPTLRDFVTLALAMDTRIARHVQLLRDLIKDVEGVNGDPKPMATHAYSAKNVITTTITVSGRPKYQSFMDATVKAYQQKQARAFDIVTDAYRPVHLSPGIGFILGFVPNPKFEAVKDGETFKIVKSEEDLTRYDVAAMLNITPDRWQEPTFGGFFQLGLTPKKDEFGFYFGAGFQAQTVFTFGGGLMLQQTRRLASGLELTSRLNSASELKTDTRFKPGFYVHATVTLPQKKN